MNPQELMKNPDVRGIIKATVEFSKEKPLVVAGAVFAAALWFLQSNGRIKAPSNLHQYAAETPEAIGLLTEAARRAGLPVELGSNPDTHWIMHKESKGWVGIPNYTYGLKRFNRNRWPEVWNELKAGIRSEKSSATGLGQLLLENVEKFYPDGVNGIGDPMNEAIGFLRYIKSRYGDPTTCRGIYGQIGYFVHSVTGKKTYKKFKEGY